MYMVLGMLGGIAVGFYLAYHYLELCTPSYHRAKLARRHAHRTFRKQLSDISKHKHELNRFIVKDLPRLSNILHHQIHQADIHDTALSEVSSSSAATVTPISADPARLREKERDKLRSQFVGASESLLRLMEKIDSVHPGVIWVAAGLEGDPLELDFDSGSPATPGPKGLPEALVSDIRSWSQNIRSARKALIQKVQKQIVEIDGMALKALNAFEANLQT
ncbi:hypothetical protein EV182_005331 [Spiromyces aspiralis]|uniref:Uncharacterized protein n=1 Tax=Spiromyces aspiralis TaxID=68401 RepID=A0ACC1HE52_9FUNG|nr:hypothetical protein EV182_005331 [Spiromyces aspiralis]